MKLSFEQKEGIGKEDLSREVLDDVRSQIGGDVHRGESVEGDALVGFEGDQVGAVAYLPRVSNPRHVDEQDLIGPILELDQVEVRLAPNDGHAFVCLVIVGPIDAKVNFRRQRICHLVLRDFDTEIEQCFHSFGEDRAQSEHENGVALVLMTAFAQVTNHDIGRTVG